MRLRHFIRMIAFTIVLAASPAAAASRIIVLSAYSGASTETLLKNIEASVLALGRGDTLLVYSGRPLSQVASIEFPTDPSMNKARVRVALATQFRPVVQYLTAGPSGIPGEPPGFLSIPTLLRELSANVISALPDKKASVLLVGSLIHVDPRDLKSSMADRYVGSDSVLAAPAAQWVFSTVGAEDRLKGSVLYFLTPSVQSDYASDAHEYRVRRFWSLYINALGGRVGSFSSDANTSFRRFNSGETAGQEVFRAIFDGKPAMLRVPAPVPASLPASLDIPGQWVLRDDAPISKAPPSVIKGTLWVGIKWHNSSCDLDLYARADPANAWLYYGNGRTSDGFFNRDFQSATGESQFEFIEFSKEVDIGNVEVAVNSYACGAAPPDATLRVFFAGKVYETLVRIPARSGGNRGAMPIAPPFWARVDLRKVVGLTKD